MGGVIGWPVVVLTLGAATAYAVSATLKHLSAGQVTDASPREALTVGRFVASTVTHRLWLLGIAADVVGVALHVVALQSGALATVQPLLVSGLVIALVLRARLGGRVQRREIAWGVLLTASLAAFLVVANTSDTNATADVVPAAIIGAAGACLAVACVMLARRRGGRAGAAALLGLSVGAIDASTAAILKSLTRLAS
ncbi:MAG: DMT family transporter, partial [Mycobacteriaceae bacterium]